LVEEFAGSLRGQYHHALKIRQAGDDAQLAQITLQIVLYISGEPQAAICFGSDLQCGRESSA
jgi:hypothetical protein